METSEDRNRTGRIVQAVTETAEGVHRDLTTLTKNVIVNAIHGLQDVTSVAAQAALENTRGMGEDLGAVTKSGALGAIAATSEVSNELGLAMKKAAIGFIHGSAEVGTELGKVCKTGAIQAIRGTGEVCVELGAMTRDNVVGTLEGGTEAASALEQFLTVAARAVMRGVSEVRTPRAPARPQVPTASLDDMPPVVADKRVTFPGA